MKKALIFFAVLFSVILLTGCPVVVPEDYYHFDATEHDILTAEQLTADLNEMYPEAKLTFVSTETCEDEHGFYTYRKVELKAEGLSENIIGYDYYGNGSGMDGFEYAFEASRSAYMPTYDFIICNYYEVKFKEQLENDYLTAYHSLIEENPCKMVVKNRNYGWYITDNNEVKNYKDYNEYVRNTSYQFTVYLFIARDFEEEGFERKFNSVCYDLYNSTGIEQYTNVVFFFARPDVYNTVTFDKDHLNADTLTADVVRKGFCRW